MDSVAESETKKEKVGEEMKKNVEKKEEKDVGNDGTYFFVPCHEVAEVVDGEPVAGWKIGVELLGQEEVELGLVIELGTKFSRAHLFLVGHF